MSKIQAVRGMSDILPTETPYWQYLEKKITETISSYNYKEIRLPIVEKTEVIHRSVGETTDIVEKETYTFIDRNEESLTLRPEGTAGCVRACIQNGMLRDQVQKLWYLGPMFRHERPQKGRYRQFYQLGIEVYGISNIAIEAELLSLTWSLWKKLGISKDVKLEINNIGTKENRSSYKTALLHFLEPLKDRLDADSQKRLYKNPLRILDSKNKDTQALLNDAPKLSEYIDASIKKEFNELVAYLKSLNIHVEENPLLVRGLDYYSKTVFEWTTSSLGAQGTICAGGRYDNLVDLLNGPKTPAVGLALGMERLLLLMHKNDSFLNIDNNPDIYIICAGENTQLHGLQLSENLRHTLSNISIEVNTQGGSFKSQFKKADKSGAQIAIVIGEDEIKNNIYNCKYLREDKKQEIISSEDITNHLRNYFSKLS